MSYSSLSVADACVVEPARNIIVIAASSSGLQSLVLVLTSIPADFPAAVIVVVHPQYRRKTSIVPSLGRSAKLPVADACEGDLLRHGRIFLAPPDFHLLVQTDGVLHLSSGPRIHQARPAPELLFASAAEVFRDRTIGVVLAGGDGDDSEGLRQIKASGGWTIAQEIASAAHMGMPRAMPSVGTRFVDLMLPLSQIAPTLKKLVNTGERIIPAPPYNDGVFTK